MIGRREFITLLGGAVTGAWPLAARAQQAERMRRVGVLMYTTPDEPESQARIAALAPRTSRSGLGYRAQRADRHPLERG
jgi:putative ABC transport system substrate-binding protein